MDIKLAVFKSVEVFNTPVAVFKAVISPSLSVIKPETVPISLVSGCPVVMRFPLISSTVLPVDTRFVETVFILVVSVCPVVIKLAALSSVKVFKTPVAVFNVVISPSLSIIKPETVLISDVNVCPVVIRFPASAYVPV